MTKISNKITTQNAPQPVGPYSQAVTANGFLFLSGQIGLTQKGKLAGETVEEQVKQIFCNIDAILQAADCSVTDVVKVTIYLTSEQDFKKVNALYEAWVRDPFPARSTIVVSKLPLNSLIEIECIAIAA